MTRCELEARLEGVKRNGKGSQARCPAHEDKNASLSVSDGKDGSTLLHCHAGCETKNVLAALGLEIKDLLNKSYISPAKRANAQTKTKATTGGCTLKAYAEAKKLSVSFLKKLGLCDSIYKRRPAIEIPYFDKNGNKTAVRYRLELEKGDGKDNRFCWRSGDKVSLYGLNSQPESNGYRLLVEGESDAQTGLQAGLQTLGVAGANNWNDERDAVHFDDVETICVIQEPDKGGDTPISHLSRSRLCPKVRVVRFSDGFAKDLNEFYGRDTVTFLSRWQAEMLKAVPLTSVLETRARTLYESCKGLAEAPDILSIFAEAIKARVYGEERAVKLLFLLFVSRFLLRPVSAVIKGPSSAGKSHITEQVSKFFPESAFYALTGGSEKSLVYSKEPLKHRIFILYEAAGLNSDFASYCLRSLLSEGRLVYETVVKGPDGPEGVRIEREGPTGAILTTTSIQLHAENETRLLSIPVDDSTEQTKHIFKKIAAENESEPDYTTWHAWSEWLEQAEHRVTIPFAEALASEIPPLATRLRRDFSTLLSLIKAHAILHQATRKKDAQGRVCADVCNDYATVRTLFADLLAQGVTAAIPKGVREAIEAVDELGGYGTKKPVSYSTIAKRLNLDVSTAWRRVQAAVNSGFLENLETREKQQAKIVTTDVDLPDDVSLLPSPDRLQVCAFAQGDKENADIEAAEAEAEAEAEAIRLEGCGELSEANCEFEFTI